MRSRLPANFDRDDRSTGTEEHEHRVATDERTEGARVCVCVLVTNDAGMTAFVAPALLANSALASCFTGTRARLGAAAFQCERSDGAHRGAITPVAARRRKRGAPVAASWRAAPGSDSCASASPRGDDYPDNGAEDGIAAAAAADSGNIMSSMRMASTGAQVYEGARIGPPPDLPSLLLHNRIVYIGMPLTAPVCELVIAELLYLNYNDPEKPVYLYINSTGTSGPDGSSAGFETDAFALIDTMNYIKPAVYTICIGSAFGLAAVLLASGAKGQRAMLPNATVMLHQPRASARGQASDIAIKAKEVMYNRKLAMEILAGCTSRPLEAVLKDSERTRYMTAEEAKEYGIIDKVLRSEKDLPEGAPAFLKNL